MKLAGIILIVIGVIALVYQGFTYTKKDTVAQIGSLKVTADDTKTVPIPPVVGGVCIAAGGVALALGGRSKL